LNKHLAKAKSTCQNLGIDYHLFPTDRPFDLALLDFLQDRMRRRKRVIYRRGSKVRANV